jgi:protein phosphatase
VAARIAVEEMAEFFRVTGRDEDATGPSRRSESDPQKRLVSGVKLANHRIRERAAGDDRLRGMGSTLVAAWFAEREPLAVVAHVGDSRAYLLRRGALTQLTEDHSLLNDYIKMRRPSAAEIEAFPHKNVIVRALGVRDEVDVDVVPLTVEPGDVLLLCCDGLSGMVADERIAEIVRATPGGLEHAARALVDAANDAGGLDNVTVVLAQVHG